MTTEYLPGDESSKNEWNKKVNAIIDKHSLEDGSGKKVLDFLFASDCHGIMFYDTCKTILDMIDSELVSQIMMQDNGNYASLKDFHDLLSDVCKNHGKVVWS